DAIARQGFPVASVDWRIPGGGEPEVVAALQRLYGSAATRIDIANAEVLRRLDQASPLVVDVGPAGKVIPGLAGKMLLHCGPPLAYADTCDPLRRSLRAAVMAEGWAANRRDADRALVTG